SVVTLAILALFLCAESGLADTVTASIGSNFNGTSIPSPRYIWFNSHLTSVSGASEPFTLYISNQHVTFSKDGSAYDVAIPDAAIHFVAGATPSSSFAANTWSTTVPDDNNDPFMSGFGWQVPVSGLSGGINPVTWTADFSASVEGLSLNWQWSAAVYTTFTDDMSLVGATPVDGAGGFSQSGSPANYSDYVVGGARGGGGSNFTGSNSGTGSVSDIPVIPEPSSLALMALVGGSGVFIRRKLFS
ncbi:MAG TPA: PEP-CTERM sorting domain-containing protein, partial [Pontiella sp.]